MKIDMKTPSIFIRAVSIFLVLTFIVGQVSAGQIVSTRSSDTLAASLVTDSNINPARSKPLQDDIAEKAEPGAIGNGAPLLELAQGKLPPRIILQGRELVVTASKLREAISVAMRLSIANKGKVPAQHQARFKKALDNLVDFQNKLEKRAYLYSADVRTPEDYLVGFSFKENVGLSLELIDRLYAISSTRLAQYIFHECVPEEGIIAERDDHRTIYNEIQSAIFDKYEVVALKQDLRGFIDGKSYAAAAEALSYIAVKNPDPIQASTIQASTIQILGDTLNKIDLDRTIQAINGVLETQGLDGSIYALAAKAKAILTTQGLDSGVYRAAIYEFIKAIETNPKIFQPFVGTIMAGVGTKKTETPAFEGDDFPVKLISPIAPAEKPLTPEIVMAQISEDLPVRAKVFASNLVQILSQHPDQLFFMGIETDIGESQKAQIMPIYKAIDQIENMTDSNGKRLFPNLMVRRAKAGELVAMASDLSKEGKLNLNNAFIGARKVSVDSEVYDSIKGEGRACTSSLHSGVIYKNSIFKHKGYYQFAFDGSPLYSYMAYPDP